jgi:hypothetical protein
MLGQLFPPWQKIHATGMGTIIHCWHYISQTPKAAQLTTKTGRDFTYCTSECLCVSKENKGINPPKPTTIPCYNQYVPCKTSSEETLLRTTA